MPKNLHTLPIVEQWDCHACSACCRGTTIVLNSEDLAKLEKQRWDQHPEFAGVRTVQRSSWAGGQQVLAHRADGSCVFLTAAGRCRIHELHGADAKPAMCRQFPLLTVMSDRGTIATVARSCPSAAADRGRPLEEQLPALKRLFADRLADSDVPTAPPIVRRIDRGWSEFQLLADTLERLVLDPRYPLVRRVIHGLRYCALLNECKWKAIRTEAVADLATVLEESAPDDVGALFQDRQPPSRSTARLFRRLGAHFIRCVPGGRPTVTWRDHWRVFRLSGQLARSRTIVPDLHPLFPATQVERLERPLGPLGDDILRSLDRFFAAQIASRRFVINSRRNSLVQSYRSLAFTLPMAFWMLRWLSAERPATPDDMVQIVVALDRGLALPALTSAADYLAESSQLEKLIAWYGR
jgi:lysine-N-methylase